MSRELRRAMLMGKGKEAAARQQPRADHKFMANNKKKVGAISLAWLHCWLNECRYIDIGIEARHKTRSLCRHRSWDDKPIPGHFGQRATLPKSKPCFEHDSATILVARSRSTHPRRKYEAILAGKEHASNSHHPFPYVAHMA